MDARVDLDEAIPPPVVELLDGTLPLPFIPPLPLPTKPMATKLLVLLDVPGRHATDEAGRCCRGA